MSKIITIAEIEASREWAIEAKAALDAALAVMAEVKATIAAEVAALTDRR